MTDIKHLLEEDKETAEDMNFLAKKRVITTKEIFELGPIEKYRDFGTLI